MQHRESSLQSSCVKWFRLQYPKLRNRLIAIPNGGHRNKITGAILKREGLIAGTPDLLLAIPKSPFGGMWIEMKSQNGRLSSSQKEMLEEFGNDYRIAICRSFDEFQQAVNNYLK